MRKEYAFIVIGAGIAGLSAVKKIKELEPDSTVLLISNEDRLPYKRTSINKAISSGFTTDQFSLEPLLWYTNNYIDLIYNQVISLDADKKTIVLKTNEQIGFGKLLFANGSSPFIPPIEGITEKDFTHVRNAHQVELLLEKVNKMQQVLIVGAGVEAIETADQLHRLGKKVIMADHSPDPLAKLFPHELTRIIYKSIAEAGIVYCTNTIVSHIDKIGDSKYRVTLCGNSYEIDGIILCAGIRPNKQIAEQAGIIVNRGILVNEFMQTSDPNIFAAGDVAEHAGGLITGLWHPAEYQGINAGQNMVNPGTIYQSVPLRLKTTVFGKFFFSSNYTLMHNQADEVITKTSDQYFARYYLNHRKIKALVLYGDKEHTKLYQNAVAKAMDMDDFLTQLSNQ